MEQSVMLELQDQEIASVEEIGQKIELSKIALKHLFLIENFYLETQKQPGLGNMYWNHFLDT